LPSEAEDASEDGSDIDMSDDGGADDLDDYYRELGIDPEEMKPAALKKPSSKAKDGVYVTKEKKETAE